MPIADEAVALQRFVTFAQGIREPPAVPDDRARIENEVPLQKEPLDESLAIYDEVVVLRIADSLPVVGLVVIGERAPCFVDLRRIAMREGDLRLAQVPD